MSLSPLVSSFCRASAAEPAGGPGARVVRCGRLTVTSLLILSVVIAGTVHAEPAHYDIDSEHVTVAFLVDHLGYAKVLGQFRELEGSFRFDDATGALSDVMVSVETDSVSTDHRRRDRHLRSDDFLDSDRYPTMTFTANSARRTADRTFEVTGNLELLGVTRPLTLTATWNKSSKHPIEGDVYAMGVSARGSLRRSDYGMTYSVENGWVGDTVEILIEFEARRR